MKTCSVCRKEILTKDPAVLFLDQSGEDKEVCADCEKQMSIVMESDKPDEIRSAINYIYTCSLSVSDDEVARFLKQTIELNSSSIEEQETKLSKNKPVNINEKRDYFTDIAEKKENSNDADGSFWITGLKIFAWIGFVVILISGVASSIMIGEWIGFLTLLASAIIAFVSVAVIMVFLKIADDISKIKKSVYKNKQ